MWSAFSSPPPTPCESQSRLPPRTAVHSICQAARLQKASLAPLPASKGRLWPGPESKGRSSWHGANQNMSAGRSLSFCFDQTPCRSPITSTGSAASDVLFTGASYLTTTFNVLICMDTKTGRCWGLLLVVNVA